MIIALLQARMSSTRLPGKVFKPILGTPMLLMQIERIQRAKSINKLMVVTSADESDDPIEDLCKKEDINFYRGSLNDVLDRYFQASRHCNAEHIIRLTGDCPFTSPELIDDVVEQHLREGNDYTSNTITPTFPDGLDVEIFRTSCLETAWKEAILPSQREHVTPYIYQHPERFTVGSLTQKNDISYLRWTVDEPIDLELVKTVYEALYPKKPAFTTNDIWTFIEQNPKLKTINTIHKRNEGFEKSLLEDYQNSDE